jgi:hypothetical protein
MVQKNELPAYSLYVKTAFLTGDFDEILFMKIPRSYNKVHKVKDMKKKSPEIESINFGAYSGGKEVA